jgi:streptomycin 6-kinase
MSDARERLARRHAGPAFGAWWDSLPQRTAALAGRWGLELGEPIPRGNTSLLIRCRRGSHLAVLKLSPDAELAAEEARALRAWQPTGCVPAVWEYEGDALLLEALEPGTPIADGPRRDTAELRALLDGLHAAPSDGFPALAERVEFIYGHWIPRVRGVSAAEMEAARELARDLAATHEGPPALLHGDLHLGNVLDSSRGLVAIDPRACAGDPDFDAVDFVLWDAAALREAEERIPALATDPERLLRWCAAFVPLIAGARRARLTTSDPPKSGQVHFTDDIVREWRTIQG